MLELLLNFGILALMAVALYILYYQARVYREQKKLILRESKALKILRNENMEALRTKFRIKSMKVKA